MDMEFVFMTQANETVLARTCFHLNVRLSTTTPTAMAADKQEELKDTRSVHRVYFMCVAHTAQLMHGSIE